MYSMENRRIVFIGLMSYVALSAAMALYGSEVDNADSISAIDDVTVKHIGPVWVPYSLWPLPRREKAVTIHMVPGFTYKLREVPSGSENLKPKKTSA